MNESQNVSIVRAAYAAFGRRDIAGVLSALAPDVVWEPIHGLSPAQVPFAGRRQGPEDVGRFFESLGRSVEFTQFEPQEFVAQGDRVVALGRYEGRVPSTGRTFASHWAMCFTVRDGKVTAFREFTDTAALASAFSPAAASV